MDGICCSFCFLVHKRLWSVLLGCRYRETGRGCWLVLRVQSDSTTDVRRRETEKRMLMLLLLRRLGLSTPWRHSQLKYACSASSPFYLLLGCCSRVKDLNFIFIFFGAKAQKAPKHIVRKKMNYTSCFNKLDLRGYVSFSFSTFNL